MYLLLIAQRTLDKLLPHYSCLSLMTLVCLQQHISLNEETESPGWPSLLLSGMQHGVVLEKKKIDYFWIKLNQGIRSRKTIMILPQIGSQSVGTG